MTSVHASQLVDQYLRRLEVALVDVPPDKRLEILDEIRGHIAEERTGMSNESDADVMNLLDRLGDPTEIAAEARGSEPARRASSAGAGFGALEVLGLALLILAWPVGAVLLWVSKRWTSTQKVLGTLVPPGGYPGVLLVISTFRRFVEMTEAGPPTVSTTVRAVLFTVSLLLAVAPIGMCIYLATRLRRAS